MEDIKNILEVSNLRAGYDRHDVIEQVSLTVKPGEIVCIAGNNGSGKSTLLKTLMGLLQARAGETKIDKQPVTNFAPEFLVRDYGVGYLLQENPVFPRLTVEDHLKLAHRNNETEDMDAIKQQIPRLLDENFNYLKRGGQLSGGEKRYLGIANLLAQGSRNIWLMDEPSSGIAPNKVKEIMEKIQQIRDELGITVLMVEQNLKAGLSISDRAVVMKNGTIVDEHDPQSLLKADNLQHIFMESQKEAL